ARGLRSLLDLGRLLEEHGGRRGLQDEGERPVLVDRDLDRDDGPALALGLRVVLLAEVHDRHAVRAQRGADRGRGRRAPCGDLDLDDGSNLLLRHDGSTLYRFTCAAARARRQRTSLARTPGRYNLATWLNSSSTGVGRPKMSTSTFTLSWSSLISMI